MVINPAGVVLTRQMMLYKNPKGVALRGARREMQNTRTTEQTLVY